MERAIFGAGCFWGVEEAFRQLPGVHETAVGYCGGATQNPTYREVCSDSTGHAEVVLVVYDPDEVTYDELLDLFWRVHDPTQFNRQGPDVGSQYRSVIFCLTPEQDRAARDSKERMQQSERFRGRRIVTEILPAREFWRAEDYHQQYLAKRGLGSCHA